MDQSKEDHGGDDHYDSDHEHNGKDPKWISFAVMELAAAEAIVQSSEFEEAHKHILQRKEDLVSMVGAM